MRVFTFFAWWFVVGSLAFGGAAAFADASSPFLATLPTSQGESPAFVVCQTIQLDRRENGIAGALQILQDARVTEQYRQTWGTSADPVMALGPDDPFVKSLIGHPLKNGRIRLVDRRGDVLAVESFAAPLAKIETVYLYGTRFPTYLVSVDYGIGAGSYAGPATTLMEVRAGRLIDLPISVGSSLKNGWEIVAARRGRAKEIEVVQSHPNYNNPKPLDDVQFVIDYTTYRFTNGTWTKKTNEKNGIWEADDGWPARSAFP